MKKKKKKEKISLLPGHKKQVRRKLRFQSIYIWMVIAPYIYIVEATYNIFNDPDPLITLSRIGWRTQVGGPRGVWFLVAFIVLSCPFMVYQVWFYLKHSGRKGQRSWRLLYLSIAGAFFVALGAAMPYNKKEAQAPVWHALHNGFAVLGSLLTVLTVTLIFVQICRETNREIILVFYGIFAAAVYYAYTILVNAAAFQIGITFVIFLSMFYINRTVLRQNLKKNYFKLYSEGVER